MCCSSIRAQTLNRNVRIMANNYLQNFCRSTLEESSPNFWGLCRNVCHGENVKFGLQMQLAVEFSEYLRVLADFCGCCLSPHPLEQIVQAQYLQWWLWIPLAESEVCGHNDWFMWIFVTYQKIPIERDFLFRPCVSLYWSDMKLLLIQSFIFAMVKLNSSLISLLTSLQTHRSCICYLIERVRIVRPQSCWGVFCGR